MHEFLHAIAFFMFTLYVPYLYTVCVHWLTLWNNVLHVMHISKFENHYNWKLLPVYSGKNLMKSLLVVTNIDNYIKQKKNPILFMSINKTHLFILKKISLINLSPAKIVLYYYPKKSRFWWWEMIPYRTRT